MKRFLTFLLSAALLLSPVAAYPQGTPYGNLPRFSNQFPAKVYGTWQERVFAGAQTAGQTGAYTLSMNRGYTVSTGGGAPFVPYSVTAPITVGIGTGVQETVTPTAVSGCGLGINTPGACQITATFANTHGSGTLIQSGSNGLQEALNVAQANGGGTVMLDSSWWTSGGTNAIIAAAVPYAAVGIADSETGQNWYPAATTATVIGVPATLTATTVGFALNGANATSGTYTGTSTYHVTWACVDVLGRESQPAADFSGLTAGTSATTYQIGIAAPAQPTGGGCVGWVPYISLAAGSYALAYRVPLATYSGGIATSNGVCVGGLTTIENITAACKIVNTTYGQTGGAAIISALTLATARIWVGVGGTSTTADVVGNSDARQTYAYTPGIRPGLGATVETHLAFTAATGPATTAPAVVATIHLYPGMMNYVGRTIKVCGNLTSQGGSTATVDQIEFYWDADGSNGTGAGVIIPGAKITNTLSATPALRFCQNLTTTVAGAGATAGSIQPTEGDLGETMSVASTASTNFFTVPNIVPAAVGSLNLAQEARLDIAVLHTTGTDGTWTANSITVTPLN